MSTTRSIAPRAPATEPPPGPTPRPSLGAAALLVCAHGVGGGPGVAAAHAAALAGRGLFAEVRACCLKGRPGLAEAVAGLRAERVYLVPFLMAEGHTLGRLLLPAVAALDGGAGRLVVCRPVGAGPRLADCIAARAEAACRRRGWRPRDTALLVVGHGTRRDPNSNATAYRHAARLAAAGRFATVATAFLDEPPSVPAALARLAPRRSVVVGLFADRGPHGADDVPRLLGAGADAVYAGPVGLDPGLAEIILEQASEARAAGGVAA